MPIPKEATAADFAAIPRVMARAVLSMPPLTDGGEAVELELLEVSGTPQVVAAAIEQLDACLLDIMPTLIASYKVLVGEPPTSTQGA